MAATASPRRSARAKLSRETEGGKTTGGSENSITPVRGKARLCVCVGRGVWVVLESDGRKMHGLYI